MVRADWAGLVGSVGRRAGQNGVLRGPRVAGPKQSGVGRIIDAVFRIGHQDQVDVGDMSRGAVQKGRQRFSGSASAQDLGYQRDAGQDGGGVEQTVVQRAALAAQREIQRARQREGDGAKHDDHIQPYKLCAEGRAGGYRHGGQTPFPTSIRKEQPGVKCVRFRQV